MQLNEESFVVALEQKRALMMMVEDKSIDASGFV